MPTSMQSISIKLFGSQVESFLDERYQESLQGAISKFLCRICETSSLTQGLHRHVLLTISHIKSHGLIRNMKENMFLLGSRIRLELIRRVGRRVFVGMVQKTFCSDWISLRRSRQMPQGDSISSQLPQLAGIRAPGLETSALASCDICWWVQGQPLKL